MEAMSEGTLRGDEAVMRDSNTTANSEADRELSREAPLEVDEHEEFSHAADTASTAQGP